MCRLVREGGNGSLLWPQGCISIDEVPDDLMRAVAQGFMILDWHEHLVKEEVPPRWMWHVDHELEAWFEAVEQKREEKYGPKKDDDEGGDMMSNELAKELRG